jgi:hypothetical protein
MHALPHIFRVEEKRVSCLRAVDGQEGGDKGRPYNSDDGLTGI